VKTPKVCKVTSTIFVTTAPLIIGNVILHNLCHAFAPSIFDASSISCGISSRAAWYINIQNAAPCQIFTKITLTIDKFNNPSTRTTPANPNTVNKVPSSLKKPNQTKETTNSGVIQTARTNKPAIQRNGLSTL